MKLIGTSTKNRCVSFQKKLLKVSYRLLYNFIVLKDSSRKEDCSMGNVLDL